MTDYLTWPDDLWRSELLSGEEIIKILALDVTFQLELNSGEIIEVNPAQGQKLKLVPVDFATVAHAALELTMKE